MAQKDTKKNDRFEDQPGQWTIVTKPSVKGIQAKAWEKLLSNKGKGSGKK